LAGEQPGDLLNICAGLVSRGWLLRPRQDGVLVADPYRLAQDFRADPQTLERIIEELRQLFDAVADGRAYELRVLPGSSVVFDAGALKAGKPPYIWHREQTGRDGMVQAAVWSAIGTLDHSEEGAMVRRCQREACRRVFLATRPKQVFCGRPCASAAVFERYKQKLGEEGYRAKHRETARLSSRRKRRRAAKQQKGERR
jgi:hypothetical protein